MKPENMTVQNESCYHYERLNSKLRYGLLFYFHFVVCWNEKMRGKKRTCVVMLWYNAVTSKIMLVFLEDVSSGGS